MDILIISGLSGAGKSRVAGILEDLDYYCVDNMPVALMPKFAELCIASRGRYEHVALVTDVRTIKDFGELFKVCDDLGQMGCPPRILFVEASVETIVKRYKETRRRHPLSTEGADLAGTVEREAAMLAPVKQRADYIVDTSDLTLGQLQRRIYKLFSDRHDKQPITVSIVSFGYKYGIPIDADMVLDARFLPNPYYVPELKEGTGQDAAVRDYVFSSGQADAFLDKLAPLIAFLLPGYVEEGKRCLVIAVGCTGGRHRSVAIAEAVKTIADELGYPAECFHRDIDK
ncbi:MAG: RNase adapter RapZ [Oscillospiraceae bacterium]|nr:RNase adapter RapZ [Oscillospiraceae bacterium]